MSQERRNLYRILHVQPEAPADIIKASYRALMSKLRMHPDLGGCAQTAARINTAYETLMDPERRRVYDLSLVKPRRGAAAAEASNAFDAARWLADRRCPFCAKAFASPPQRDTRCHSCDSPLFPAPMQDPAAGELLGRRGGERFAREMDARLCLHGQPAERPARVRDLSLTGVSLVCMEAVPQGTAIRVVTQTFDAVACVVTSRKAGAACTVHGRLQTLQLLRAKSGVFVNARA